MGRAALEGWSGDLASSAVQVSRVVVVGMLAAAGLSLLVQDTRPRHEPGVLMTH